MPKFLQACGSASCFPFNSEKCPTSYRDPEAPNPGNSSEKKKLHPYGFDSRKTPGMLSELFLEFLSRVRLGTSKPYGSRDLALVIQKIESASVNIW